MEPEKPESYLAVEHPGRVEIVVKGSRFIAVAESACSRDIFKAVLDSERSKYPDATHHCWAFRIGSPNPEELSSDDGEPSGSAGLPILRILAGAEIVDACCVVTRYFGGTKLGVGGLMRAYGQAASNAIKDALITEKLVTERFSIVLPYQSHSEFVASVNHLGGSIVESKFGEKVALTFDIPVGRITEITGIAANLTHGAVIPEKVITN